MNSYNLCFTKASTEYDSVDRSRVRLRPQLQHEGEYQDCADVRKLCAITGSSPR